MLMMFGFGTSRSLQGGGVGAAVLWPTKHFGWPSKELGSLPVVRYDESNTLSKRADQVQKSPQLNSNRDIFNGRLVNIQPLESKEENGKTGIWRRFLEVFRISRRSTKRQTKLDQSFSKG
jgi:hypothetical protein